jgi:hypothetical protein
MGEMEPDNSYGVRDKIVWENGAVIKIYLG